jgi:uncharacterized protein
MEYSIITSDNFKPKSWPGGTTTELFIFPQTADYTQRNFQFRISTATVESDRSDFTQLRGISRKLMVLSGNIILNHEDHYSRQLSKFDTDEFEGEWRTSSQGKCTDFNLMTTGKTKGVLAAIIIEKNHTARYKINGFSDWLFMYLYSGKVSIDLNNKPSIIDKGDLLVVNKLIITDLIIKGIEQSELVFSQITL